MKRFLFIHAMLWLLVLACGPKPQVPAPADMRDPGEILWQQAEAQFQAGALADARSLFEAYLTQAPGGPRTDQVLYRLGTIYARQGLTEQSRNAYQRLVDVYPDSPLVADALLELLGYYYEAGEYLRVLEAAPGIISRPVSDATIFETYTILGDTHMALMLPADAVLFYTMAHDRAPETERAATVERLKLAIWQLDTPQIVTLLNRLEDNLPIGYLLYQFGLNSIEQKDYAEAVDAFEELLSRFPDHEYASDAAVLVDELRTSYVFRRDIVGVLLPLSGPYKPYGLRALAGVELALHHHHRRSRGEPITLIVRDTAANPETARAAVRELFDEQAAMIIGPIITAGAAAEEAEAIGMPIITLSQKEDVTANRSFVFRNFLTPRMQVETLLLHTVRRLGLQRFAILYPDENYGDTFMRLFWERLIDLDGTVVGVEAYKTDQTDFADAIKKLVGLYYPSPDTLRRPNAPNDPLKPVFLEERLSGDGGSMDPEISEALEKLAKEDEPKAIVDFEAVFIPDAPAMAGMIVPQLAYYDVQDVVLLGTNLWHSQRLLEMAGEYMNGALVADGFFPESRFPVVRDFVAAFEETFGRQPRYVEAAAYDTAGIVLDLVARSPHVFRGGLRTDLLSAGSYSGVTGRTSFDQTGEARKRLFLLQVKGRRFVELAPSPWDTQTEAAREASLDR